MCGRIAVFVLLTLALAKHDKEELPAHKRQSVQYSTLVGPSFVETGLHANSHAPVGKTAYLTCKVKNLHNYTVSWVRARDIHLLTTGETTYTSDNRFVSVNPGGGDQWMLRIHHIRPSDAGIYLCQVSISPPMSASVNLRVTESSVKVLPGSDVYLKAGSRVVLVCEVSGCPYPASPTWYKGHELQGGIDTVEGRIQTAPAGHVPTHPSMVSSSFMPTLSDAKYISQKSSNTNIERASTKLKEESNSTTTPPGHPPSSSPKHFIGLPVATATLKRAKASAKHSGVYTCTNTCTDPINVTLHVLTGEEETAAMQHPSGSPGTPILCHEKIRILIISMILSSLVNAMHINSFS